MATPFQDVRGKWWAGRANDMRYFGGGERAAQDYARSINVSISVYQELQGLIQDFMDQVQTVVDATANPLRIWQANGMDAAIAATADGAPVGDSDWPKERWQEIDALNLAFQTWINTPLDNGLTPLQIISKR
jgi:hypothetical protein